MATFDSLAQHHLNAEVDWSDFDPVWYWRHNYETLLDEDRQIIGAIRDHFSQCAPPAGELVIGIDVGTGANFYPAMAMLPFCSRLDLVDYSPTNVEWIKDRLDHFGRTGRPWRALRRRQSWRPWRPFWGVYETHPPFTSVADPPRQLSSKATVSQGSVFELPVRRWNLGTMMFVADSLSDDFDEFDRALRCFIGALTSGAPFAVAFMAESEGYHANALGEKFPAVKINHEDVRRSLTGIALDVRIDQIPLGSNPFREGYRGMLLAVGRTAQ